MDMIRATERIIREQELFRRGDRIVAAVSGGPDSVALLHILAALAPGQGWSLVAAHAKHGLRGEESEEDARFVRALAARLGLPYEEAELPVREALAERGGNLQDTARSLRYRFLLETAERVGAGKIALAHHADDQAETVMLHIVRGSGTSGLAGMRWTRREKNVELVRPLLRMNKQDLVRFCEERDIPYRIDSSNRSAKYARNDMRFRLFPLLAEMNPQIVPSLCRLSELAQAEEDWMDGLARDAAERAFRKRGAGFEASRKTFAALPVALQRRLIKLILNYLSVPAESCGFDKVESARLAAVAAGPSTMKIDMGAGARFVREYDAIRFDRPDESPESEFFYYEVTGIPAELELPLGRLSFSRQTAEEPGGASAVLDADLVRWPLIVRARQAGDRLRLPGVGTKKLKDLLIDEKVPPSVRDRLPIVCDADGRILWVAGIRLSELAQINERTENALHIHYDGIIQ